MIRSFMAVRFGRKLFVPSSLMPPAKIDSLVGPIVEGYRRKAKELVAQDSPYEFHFPIAEQILRRRKDQSFGNRIRNVFQSHFVKSESKFDKTLFNFCLRRLANLGDDVAVDHCLDFMRTHPEITKTVLEYLGAINAWPIVEKDLTSFLTGDDAVYSYQKYQVIESQGRRNDVPASAVLDAIRTICFDDAEPPYVRISGYNYLRRFGTPTDLNLLRQRYAKSADSVERASILCSLARMEKNFRNEFLGRVQTDGDLERRAVRLVKTGSL